MTPQSKKKTTAAKQPSLGACDYLGCSEPASTEVSVAGQVETCRSCGSQEAHYDRRVYCDAHTEQQTGVTADALAG